MVLLHRAKSVEMLEKGKKAVPGTIGIEENGRLAGEIHIEGLVTDEDRNRLEHILQRRARGEHEGVGLDDLTLDVGEGNALVAVGIIDVPAFAEETVKKPGTDFAIGIFFSADGSSETDFWHDDNG